MDKKLSWPFFGRRAFIFRNGAPNTSIRSRGLAREPVRAAPRCTPRWTSATGSAARAPSTARAPARAVLAPPARPLARRHRRRRGVTPGRDVRAHPREVLAHPERGRGDRAARRGHPRDARETGGPARAGGAAEGGRGPHGRRGGGHPGAGRRGAKIERRAHRRDDDAHRRVDRPIVVVRGVLRERQRILMDRAALANRLAGVAPTDADEAFFDANDAALREMREERAAYARREAAEAAAGKMVWSKSVNDAMAGVPTGGRSASASARRGLRRRPTWDDEDRVVRSDRGRSKGSATTRTATTARSIPRPSRSSPPTSAGTEPAGRSSRRRRPRLGSSTRRRRTASASSTDSALGKDGRVAAPRSLRGG